MTRDQAKAIQTSSEVFYCTQTQVQDYPVELYNYRLASYKDFKDNNAFDLRGFTCLKDNDTWITYPVLPKFFNLNENEDWAQDKIVEPLQVAEKLDGSLIQFITLPNGNIVPKTKMSSTSEQLALVNFSPKYENFIRHCNKHSLTPYFEIVSPFNQIVIQYPTTQLVCIQIQTPTGFLIPFEMVGLTNAFDIPCAKFYNYTLAELLHLKSTATDVEGWVCTDATGKLFKVKTDWYNNLHGIVNELQEHTIVKLVLDEQIDDALSQLPLGSEKRLQIESIQTKVDHIYNSLIKDVEGLVWEYNTYYKQNRKDFALANKHLSTFPLAIRVIQDIPVTTVVKDYILSKCKSLQLAQQFLKDNQ